jgi:peptidoglycan lytic transglycosylase
VIVARVTLLLGLASAAVGLGDADAQRPRARRNVQTGYATYYSRAAQADRTASGVRFDNRQLVAAHRTLAFGTRVRVTNLENGRSVTVRIIDRGPFGRNRREGTIIDLSRAAAQRLDMIEDGQVRVRVAVLSTPDARRGR